MGRRRDTILARAARGGAAACAALVVTVVMTWPLAPGLGRLGRTAPGDGLLSIWNVAWVARAIVADPLHLFDANIFYPHRDTLAYSESNLGAGVLSVPVWWLTKNAYATHNWAVLVGFATCVLAMWLLARYLSGDGLAAAPAAVLFAFAPYFFSHTPHIQLLMAGGIPLSMLMLHRLADAPAPRAGVALGLALSVQALSCAYYGIFAGLMVGYAAIFLAASRRSWTRKYWGAIAIAATIAVLSVVPFFIPYLEMQREQGFRRTLEDSVRYSANIASYLASSAHAHEWLFDLVRSSRLERWREVLFPGLMVTVFGVGGFIVAVRGARSAGRARETAWLYASLGIIAFWASFGPSALLYKLLFQAIPLFSFLRAPARFGVIVAFVLAVLSSFAFAELLRLVQARRSLVLAVVLTGFAMLELNFLPFPWDRARPIPQPYYVLARLPRGPVAEFPFYGGRVAYHLHTQYMVYSTAHWQPLLNGYSDHIPQNFRDAAAVLDGFPSDDGFAVLRRARVRYVTVNWGMFGPRRDEIRRRLKPYEEYLRPLAEDSTMTLFEVLRFP
ncbi:MAG: hypothetical protein LC804_02430 [Acidobacteria bacterium]|nr:hypothetical protein [Acidobacteriota bacterium]